MNNIHYKSFQIFELQVWMRTQKNKSKYFNLFLCSKLSVSAIRDVIEMVIYDL